jgi:hypothetical protein
MKEGRNRANLLSLEDAAEQMKVSRRSAITARKIQREASPEIIAKVDAGKPALRLREFVSRR